MRKIIKNRQVTVGLIIIVFVVILAISAPYIVPNNPNEINLSNKLSESSSKYPLGTDQLGRCVLSRIMLGTTYSISIATGTLFIIAFISITVGISSAYYGGVFDSVISNICNVAMAFPPFAVVLSLANVLGEGIISLVFSIVLSMWVWFVRVIRSYVKRELNKDYITSSIMAGCSSRQIIFNHLLPNITPTLIVYFSTSIAALILMISGYAFLGVGFDMNIPEWGAMLNNGKAYLYSSPKLIIVPGLCILFTAMGFNLFGEGLRDVLVPEGD